MSRLLAILYRSEALMPQCGVVERKMLEASRSDNVPKHITGFLHRENDVYYQWLEGPEAEVSTAVQNPATRRRKTRPGGGDWRHG
ncbi:BLUF domain-containing protein, partial [Paracoccus benzoatiresistens]